MFFHVSQVFNAVVPLPAPSAPKARAREERLEAHEARLKRIMLERWHKRQEEVPRQRRKHGGTLQVRMRMDDSLVVCNMFYTWFHILGIIIPTDLGDALVLQIPSEKVFRLQKTTPNIVSEGLWSCRDDNHGTFLIYDGWNHHWETISPHIILKLTIG